MRIVEREGKSAEQQSGRAYYACPGAALVGDQLTCQQLAHKGAGHVDSAAAGAHCGEGKGVSAVGHRHDGGGGDGGVELQGRGGEWGVRGRGRAACEGLQDRRFGLGARWVDGWGVGAKAPNARRYLSPQRTERLPGR